MALTQKEIKARYYQRKKEQGICTKCGKRNSQQGKTLCYECNEKNNEYSRQTRKFFKENHICVTCGKNKVFGDEKNCFDCKEKYRQIKNKKDKEIINKQHREWNRKTHAEMIEKGICTRCRKRNSDNGYKTCGICREKIREYRRKKSWKEDRTIRHEQGLCYFCDNVIKDGYKVCEKHYNICFENANCQKSKEVRKNHIKTKIIY